MRSGASVALCRRSRSRCQWRGTRRSIQRTRQGRPFDRKSDRRTDRAHESDCGGRTWLGAYSWWGGGIKAGQAVAPHHRSRVPKGLRVLEAPRRERPAAEGTPAAPNAESHSTTWWSPKRGSNTRPAVYGTAALPAELFGRTERARRAATQDLPARQSILPRWRCHESTPAPHPRWIAPSTRPACGSSEDVATHPSSPTRRHHGPE